jgi:threonyl-tRNA synthetase
MIKITLPDGKVLEYKSGIKASEIASSISKSLSKETMAVSINDKLVDLSTEISADSTVKFITANDKEGLEIIRHDAAHLLAQAIKNLFPKTQITIGPVIDNGFYYDILPESPLSSDDLKKIEKEMSKLSSGNIAITREVWSRDKAINFFKDMKEEFKAEIISDLPGTEEISLYRQGDFIDLCRGPHAPSTRFVKHFKLMKLAGAYWRGDSNNVMLQRIYGTAWATKQDLDDYLYMLEEAEKRDHRKIGKQIDLFHLQEEAPGMVFWHDKGWTVYRILKNFIRDKIRANGYQEVNTPILVDKVLWEKSGHWDKFRENMFSVQDDEKIMAMKPMNCPCHIEIFKRDIRSYKDLPIRMAEFGCCHRNESSGSLHGLLRVRGMTQDDAHIFCTEDQITSETIAFTSLLKDIYKELGFEEVSIKFSDRPDVRAGSDDVWDKAEKSLKNAIKSAGLPYELNKGEGAFYGPKLEFVLKDALKREWQCGTLQVDFVLPERLGAQYVAEDGSKRTPVMLHRAILGTLERFMGILIEQYSGSFPLWLAPVQTAVLTLNNEVDDYAIEIQNALKSRNYRSILDNSNEKINYKIRKHSLQKIPLLLILGRDEKENSTVTVRKLGSNEQFSYSSIESFIEYLQDKEQTRSKDY